MANNILTAQIRITAPGVETTFRKLGSELKILSIGSEKTGLAFSNLSQKVAFFGGGVRTFTASIRPAVTSLNNITPAANLAGASINKLSQTSNSATGAMINLGRVVQDAPFGFLGIANNLNPLLESFQRLKAQTGSTGSALKALGSSLTGAGGLGLAISVLSTGLILFGDKLFGMTKSFSAAELYAGRFAAALDSIGKSADDLKDKLDFGNEIAKLQAELSGLGGAKLNIVDLVNKNQANLSVLLNSGAAIADLEKVKRKYDEFAAGIIKNGELVKSTIGGKESRLFQILKEFPNRLDIPEGLIEKLSAKEQSGLNQYIGVLKALKTEQKRSVDASREIQKDSLSIGISANQAIEEDIRKQQELSDKAKSLRDKLGADYERFVSETISNARRLADAFKNTIDLKLDLSVLDTKKETFEKSLDFLDKFKAKDFKVIIDPELELSKDELKNQQDLINKELDNLQFDVKGIKTRPIPIDPQFSINTGFVKKELETKFRDLFKDFFGENSTFSKLFPAEKTFQVSATPNIKLSKKGQDNADLLAAMQKLGEQTANAFNQGLQSVAVSGFEGIGEALGEALSGGDLQSAFQAFASTVGGALQAMGKQIIAIGVAAILAKKALETLFTNPFVAVAAGIALVAAGAALKNVLSGGLQGRAKGGPVNKDEPYIVGEEGGGKGEIFVPHTSGFIIPHGKTKEIIKNIYSTRIFKTASSSANSLSKSVSSSSANVFKSITNNLGGRRLGGPVIAGIPYLVGESGRELFIPNTGSSIARNNQVGGTGMGGGGLNIKATIENILRGKDMVQLITLQNQSNNRLS